MLSMPLEFTHEVDGFELRNSLRDSVDIRLKGGKCMVNTGIRKGRRVIWLVETEDGYRGQGECTKLLQALHDKLGNNLLLWCPMNDVITHICEKVGIEITDSMDYCPYEEIGEQHG